MDASVIYQHPLGYLLGLEGIALLRAFAGAYDRNFTHARLREIQEPLDSAGELGDGVEKGDRSGRLPGDARARPREATRRRVLRSRATRRAASRRVRRPHCLRDRAEPRTRPRAVPGGVRTSAPAER